jgi:hypothetical protein
MKAADQPALEIAVGQTFGEGYERAFEQTDG